MADEQDPGRDETPEERADRNLAELLQEVRVVGPPAVGKMAVGAEIAARTGLRLFHNHLAIEPVLRFFDFDTAFGRDDYLRIDNTGLSPADAADRAIDHFTLARRPR